MRGLGKELMKFSIRGASVETTEGEIGKCGHWDNELDTLGYCRDIDCRRDRLVEALKTGKAFRAKDGTIYWNQD